MQKKSVLIAIVVVVLALIAIVSLMVVRRELSFSTGMALPQQAVYDTAGGIAGEFGMNEKSLRGESVVFSPEPPTSASDDTTAQQERLIIKSGALSIVVNDVPLAVQQIHSFATSKNGFVVSSNAYKYGESPRADVTIRIPVAIFDAAVDELGAIGEVESKQVNGQDVTEEYVDLEAQIRNLRSTEEQFLLIMKQATRIEDILAVQRELSVVRSQIEQIQGRMNYLQKSAQLSTLTIHVSTDPDSLPVVDDQDTWKPLAVAKDALRSLREVGIGLVNAFIWVAIYLPVWVLFFAIGYGIYRKVRKPRIQ